MNHTEFVAPISSDMQDGFANGQLIWHPDQSLYFDVVLQSFCHFRKAFDLDKVPENADLALYADCNYVLYVNGTYVGRGPCRSDPTMQYYDVHNVHECLQPGSNVIAVLVLYHSYGTGAKMPRIRSLWATLDIKMHDGTSQQIASDTTWQCRFASAYDKDTPRVNGRQGPIEVYDARLDTGSWIEAEYGDNSWVSAARIATRFQPLWYVAPRSIPLLEENVIDAKCICHIGWVKETPNDLPIHKRLIEETAQVDLEPQQQPVFGFEVAPNQKNSRTVFNVDFGRVECGYLQISVEGSSGAIIDVIYAEDIVDGRVLINDVNRPMDRFILREGHNECEVAFGWKAFRYIQCIVRTEHPVEIKRIGIRTRNYPFKEIGSFEVPDKELSNIRQISVHTLKLCMQDGFLDSSSREQQQWMGDARWQAIFNYYISGDRRLHWKLLEQFGQSQNWTGLTKARHPDEHLNFDTIPTFSLAWVSSFWDYYLYTGDTQPLLRWWSNIQRCLSWFKTYENNGILQDVPFWVFIDHGIASPRAAEIQGPYIVVGLNMLFLEALVCAANIAATVGDKTAATYFHEKADQLKHAIVKHLWDEQIGAYPDTYRDGQPDGISEITNALALLHIHQSNNKHSDSILQNVFICPDSNHPPHRGSTFSFCFVARALMHHGYIEKALALVRKRWGYMLDRGATTTWESWNLIWRNAEGQPVALVSASHAWGASPIILFAEGLAGVRPLEPGFKKFTLNPSLGNLPSLNATIPTPNGPIRMKATNRNPKVHVHIEIPSKTVAVLISGDDFSAGKHEITLDTCQ